MADILQPFNKQFMKQLFFIAAILLTISFTFTSCSGNTKPATEQLAKDEMYTCTMHNEVMSDHPGKCPKCGMTLVKQKMTDAQMKMMQDSTYTKPKE